MKPYIRGPELSFLKRIVVFCSFHVNTLPLWFPW